MAVLIRAGIVGGAGYTAGELMRLLMNHPAVKLEWVASSSHAGAAVDAVHTDLVGEEGLPLFTDTPRLDQADVVFLCSGHGESTKWLEGRELPKGLKIIDLAQDFRDESNGFVYGLPELNRNRIMGVDRVANPGCFATAIQLALLPLAKAGLLTSEVALTALTGSTGAGVKPSSTTHFSWRTDNISVYKPFTHQHLAEIGRSLCQAQGGEVAPINFVPVRGDFARGIFVIAHLDCVLDSQAVARLYADTYADEPFTHFSTSPIAMKQVVNTNKAIVSVEKHGSKILVTSAIDNLLKGASGQAVENMNLMFGLDERAGLKLKPSAF